MADLSIKPDGSWQFNGEDSTLKNKEDHQVNMLLTNPLTGERGYQMVNKVYCMNCGAFYGYSSRMAVWVKYLCDKCYEKGKPDWFIPMLPDEEVAWRNGLPPPEK